MTDFLWLGLLAVLVCATLGFAALCDAGGQVR